MTRNRYVVPAVVVVGMVTAACGGSGGSDSTTVTETVSASATTATAGTTTDTSATAAPTSAGADLQSLLPAPANSQRTDGPDGIQEGGVHKHFLVNGAPGEVMDGYKTALEDAGWTLVVENEGGGGGGGGATYTGTNGDAYGVFAGGGYGSTTDVNSCAWPAKPSDTNCGSNN